MHGAAEEMDVEKLYSIDMHRKVILSMKLPALGDNYIFKSYKVMLPSVLLQQKRGGNMNFPKKFVTLLVPNFYNVTNLHTEINLF